MVMEGRVTVIERAQPLPQPVTVGSPTVIGLVGEIIGFDPGSFAYERPALFSGPSAALAFFEENRAVAGTPVTGSLIEELERLQQEVQDEVIIVGASSGSDSDIVDAIDTLKNGVGDVYADLLAAPGYTGDSLVSANTVLAKLQEIATSTRAVATASAPYVASTPQASHVANAKSYARVNAGDLTFITYPRIAGVTATGAVDRSKFIDPSTHVLGAIARNDNTRGRARNLRGVRLNGAPATNPRLTYNLGGRGPSDTEVSELLTFDSASAYVVPIIEHNGIVLWGNQFSRGVGSQRFVSIRRTMHQIAIFISRQFADLLENNIRPELFTIVSERGNNYLDRLQAEGQIHHGEVVPDSVYNTPARIGTGDVRFIASFEPLLPVNAISFVVEAGTGVIIDEPAT